MMHFFGFSIHSSSPSLFFSHIGNVPYFSHSSSYRMLTSKIWSDVTYIKHPKIINRRPNRLNEKIYLVNDVFGSDLQDGNFYYFHLLFLSFSTLAWISSCVAALSIIKIKYYFIIYFSSKLIYQNYPLQTYV